MLRALGLGKSLVTNDDYLQQIVDFFIVDLEEGAVNIEKRWLIVLIESFNFLKQSEDGSGDKSSIVFVEFQILEKSILLLFALCVFGDGVLPVTTEHGMGFTWACLTVGEYS